MKGLRFVFLIFTVVLIFCEGQIWAQNKIDSVKRIRNQQVILDVALGGIVSHNPPVAHLAQSHPRIYSIEYSLEDLLKEWSRAYSCPKVGVSLQYFDYQNPEILGTSLAGLFFMEPRLTSRFSYRLGSGVVVNFKPFNLENNTKNLMLGSRLAMVMHGQFSYYQPVNSKVGFRFGLGLTHFSNGAFTQPNSGINVFFASIGAVVWPRGRKIFVETVKDKFQPNYRFSVDGFASFSMVEKLPVGGPKYPVFHASVRPNYRVGRKSSLYSGLDFCYNEARAQLIRDKPWFGRREGRLGFLIGHELHISNLSLITDFGFYVIKPHEIDPWLYQRYGFRWKISGPTSILLLLKVHRSKAECLELGVGYAIFSKSSPGKS